MDESVAIHNHPTVLIDSYRESVGYDSAVRPYFVFVLEGHTVVAHSRAMTVL